MRTTFSYSNFAEFVTKKSCLCAECLPEERFCGDVLHHKHQPLHNRESVIDGFLKPFLHPHVLLEWTVKIAPIYKVFPHEILNFGFHMCLHPVRNNLFKWFSLFW